MKPIQLVLTIFLQQRELQYPSLHALVATWLANAFAFPQGCHRKYYADKTELYEERSRDFRVSTLTSNPTSISQIHDLIASMLAS